MFITTVYVHSKYSIVSPQHTLIYISSPFLCALFIHLLQYEIGQLCTVVKTCYKLVFQTDPKLLFTKDKTSLGAKLIHTNRVRDTMASTGTKHD